VEQETLNGWRYNAGGEVEEYGIGNKRGNESGRWN